MTYLLDTTLLIDYSKGRADGVQMLDRLFQETGVLYTCDIVTCEALTGGVPYEHPTITRLLDAGYGKPVWASEGTKRGSTR